MCSTFKLLAVAAVLRRVDEGEENLTREILVQEDEILAYAPITAKHAGKAMTMFDLYQRHDFPTLARVPNQLNSDSRLAKEICHASRCSASPGF